MLSSRDPITFEASLRNALIGRSGLVSKFLEKALHLPDDLQELKGLRKCEMFLSLKRDLAKVSREPLFFHNSLILLNKIITCVSNSFENRQCKQPL